MSKIIIITNRLVVGGPSVHLKQIVDSFADKHKILLVYGPPSKGESSMVDVFRSFGIEMLQLESLKRSINLFNDYILAKELKEIFNDFKPDIIHTHTYKPGFAGRYIASKIGGVKIIHTYHGLIFHSYFSSIISTLLVIIDRFLAEKTDIIITLSERQRNDIISKYKIAQREKVKVIPLASDYFINDFSAELKNKFKYQWNIDSKSQIIAQVGRLTDVKNISLMLDVFYELRKRVSTHIVLFIVGDGDLKESLIEQAQSLHFKVANGQPRDNADVVFTSWCKDLKALYSAMDLLILTSKNEGTPLNIIEAQVAGIPVVAPRVGGIVDMIIEGETAELYNSASEIEDILFRLLNDKNLLIDMGKNAAAFAAKKYSLDIMLKEYEKLYN